MEHLLFFASVLVAAAVAALLEVQIEGKAGWASGLPTWRWENAFTRALLGNRAITGYHLLMHVFVIVLVHLPFGLGLAEPGWGEETRILAFLTLFWVLEDFLWFVVNPAFGIRAFRRERIWWHQRSWWGALPRDYWIFVPVGLALYLLSLHIVS